MIDSMIDRARRNDCLMAVTPDNGGSWVAPIRVSVTGVPQPSTPTGTGSFAIQTGLLTYSNVRTDRGVFEADNTAAAWNAKTGIDFRGWNSSLTIIAKCYVAPDDGTGQTSYHPIVTQGFYAGGNTAFCMALLCRDSRVMYSIVYEDGQQVTRVVNHDARTQTTVFVVTRDVLTGVHRLYANGVLLDEHTRTSTIGAPIKSTGDSNLTDRAYLHQYAASFQNFGDKIEYALVFDAVLSPEQIALFK